jgi:hypothetical protein
MIFASCPLVTYPSGQKVPSPIPFTIPLLYNSSIAGSAHEKLSVSENVAAKAVHGIRRIDKMSKNGRTRFIF